MTVEHTYKNQCVYTVLLTVPPLVTFREGSKIYILGRFGPLDRMGAEILLYSIIRQLLTSTKMYELNSWLKCYS